jgi:hypothetical protein
MKRAKILVGLAIGLVVSSCSSTKEDFLRNPASVIENKSDLLQVVNALASDVQLGTNNTMVCRNELRNHYQILYHLTSDNLRMEALTAGTIDEIVKSSFTTRISIMNKLRALKVVNKTDKDCLSSVKDVVRALRYVEDYLIEIKTMSQGKKDEKEFVTLTGKGIHFLVNPKYANTFKDYNSLQSGDIILSRGNAYTSAAIARIGENDSQFSHISFVYKDEKGKLYTTEAHIEIGSITAPIIEHINQANARSVVFRYKDQALAHKASRFIFEKVKKAQDKKKNIEYDFAMDYKNSDRLFCSEIVSHGMSAVSGGKIDVPKYKTTFSKGLIPFLSTLGIPVTESNVDKFDTFAPGDMQFDSDFEIIAEWRNPAKMKDNRMKDAILTMMFRFMEEDKMQLRPGAKLTALSKASWLLRRTPFIKQKLKERFPLNMNTNQLKMFLVLDEAADVFYAHLEELHKNRAHPLTPIEMFSALEKFKNEEMKRYKVYQKASNELNQLTSDRDNRDSRREWELRKVMKENRPRFANWFR